MTRDKKECTKEQFLIGVKDHAIEIIRDSGVNRHIRFSRPESSIYRFDLITWPGHICYTGDMGTYVFSRVNDMFTFFGDDLDDKTCLSPINPGYWGEKLLSESRFGEGFREYSENSFTECIKEEFEEYYSDVLDDEEELACSGQMEETWEEIEDQVLRYTSDGQDVTMRNVRDFKASDGFEFDIEYVQSMEFTFHYIWCCYALVWGIGLYNKAVKNNTKVA